MNLIVAVLLGLTTSTSFAAEPAALNAGSTQLAAYQDRLLVGGSDGDLALLELRPSLRITPLGSAGATVAVHKFRDDHAYLYTADGRMVVVDFQKKKMAETVALPFKDPVDVAQWGKFLFVSSDNGRELLKISAETQAVEKISLDTFAVPGGKVEAHHFYLDEEKSRLFVQIHRTQGAKEYLPGLLAVYDLNAGRFVKTIELRGQDEGRDLVGTNPDFSMPYDLAHNQLLVAAKGKALTGQSMYFSVDFDSLSVRSVKLANAGEQGPIGLVSGDGGLVIFHTHTPVRSSHLFGFSLDKAGAFRELVGKGTILDTFDSLNQLELNPAHSLAVMPQSCLVFCAGGNQLKFVDVAQLRQVAFLGADVLGFAPRWSLFAETAPARTPSSVEGPGELFRDRAILVMTLTAPWKKLAEGALLPGKDVKFPVELKLASGQTLTGEVNARGNTSRRECEMPKLKLALKKTEGTIFAEAKKFKLNTHCGEGELTALGRLADETATLREALVHEMGQELGLALQAVRRARIKYVDSETGKTTERLAVLIEDPDQTAERWLGTKFDGERYASDAPKTMGWNALAKTYLFEAMVGNWDFHLDLAKKARETDDAFERRRLWNMKIIQLARGHELPMPFDFDMASMVSGQLHLSGNLRNTKFLESSSLLERYLGYELLRGRKDIPLEELREAAKEFKAHKRELGKLIAEPFVDEEGAENAHAHLDAFFSLLGREGLETPILRGYIIEGTSEPGGGKVLCAGLPDGSPVRLIERVKGFAKIEPLGIGCNASALWVPEETVGE